MGIIDIMNKKYGVQDMKKRRFLEEFIILFWLFVLGSVIGYLYEMIVVLFQKGFFESRQGLVYGPFTPVYGIGMMVYYVVLNIMDTKSKPKVFFITMLLGGVTEYLCSWVQECVFGTISWDYSYLHFNLNGRTSLLHCTYWGIAGILYATFMDPILQNIKKMVYQKRLKLVTMFVVIFMVLDIHISCMAAYRQFERKRKIEPANEMDEFLDEHYPDEYMDRIFANKKEKF